MEQYRLIPGEPVGIVAGGGQFPLLCARAAMERNHPVVAVAHKEETSRELEGYCSKIKWIRLGQLNRLISFFKRHGVRSAIFAGTIKKTRIFLDVRPDLRALGIWNRMKGHLDDDILRALAEELEGEGIRVLPSTVLLERLLFPRGILTTMPPTEKEWQDIRFGLRLAREIGRLDIGQCMVVKDLSVLAVEAIEGTDETIRRGGRLGGTGTVVVKICKPGQDERFDLPSIGSGTIETMIESGARVLAVEAGRSLFFDMEQGIALADRHRITVVGLVPSETDDIENVK